MTPTELIAHAVPRLLEEQGLKPRAPVGDEILLDGERADDPVWLMITPLPRDAAGHVRARESLAARFRPGDPPTRGLGLLVFLRSGGAEPDLAALDALPTPQGTQPILRAMTLDLQDGRLTGEVSRVAPLASIARTIEKAAMAAVAGKAPPDFRQVVEGQVNLARAYRARRPWATWALTTAIVAVFLLQRPFHQLVNWQAAKDRLPDQKHLYITNALFNPAPDVVSMVALFILLLTVMTLLALGSLIERLFGWMSLVTMWFACATGSAWIAFHRTPGLIMSGAQTAVFGIMGAEVALALARRSIPWTFRKGLLVTSVPFIIVNGVLVALGSRAVTEQILSAVIIGVTLAAVLPLRPPLSARGGPLLVKLLLAACVAACAVGLGVGVRDLFPRPATYDDPDGWHILAPAGYKLNAAPGATPLWEGRDLRVTVDVRDAVISETMRRLKEEESSAWKRTGATMEIDEEVQTGGTTWGHLRWHTEDREYELYVSINGVFVVRVRGEGRKGAVRLYGADVRMFVDTFRPAR